MTDAGTSTRSRPDGRAAARSRTGGGKVSDAKGRQRRFKNRMVFAYVTLLLIPLTFLPLTFGIAEIAVHGGPVLCLPEHVGRCGQWFRYDR